MVRGSMDVEPGGLLGKPGSWSLGKKLKVGFGVFLVVFFVAFGIGFACVLLLSHHFCACCCTSASCFPS